MSKEAPSGDECAKLRQGRDELRRQIADAARLINCSGPLAHRIQILKTHHGEQVMRLIEERDALVKSLQRTGEQVARETCYRCEIGCGVAPPGDGYSEWHHGTDETEGGATMGPEPCEAAAVWELLRRVLGERASNDDCNIR